MGTYTAFKDSYKKETTYGTGIITLAADATYLWGAISKESIWPSPKTSINYRATGVSAQEVPDTELWKDVFSLTGMMGVGMQNGILIWAVMGKSSTAGVVHTITTPTAVAGVLPLLPSFTLQHERTGTATAWSTQFLGCKVGRLRLSCGYEQRILVGIVDWIAKKAQDPQDAYGWTNLTTAPVLPATSNAAPYHFNNLTRTFNGVAIDGLVSMELEISPDLQAEWAHTFEAGVWTGNYLRSLIEAPRKQYKLTMEYHPDSDDMWDELIAQGNTKNIVFTWTRAAADYITATLTDCQVMFHELKTPEVGKSLIETVEIEPRSVTFTVSDALAGSAYGE